LSGKTTWVRIFCGDVKRSEFRGLEA